MRRRELLLLLATDMLGAPAVHAQRKAMPVIGWRTGSSRGFAPIEAAFLQGLGETGYVEGQNVAIEHRYAEGRF
jgi:putative ABC transport system substrate-binding protein